MVSKLVCAEVRGRFAPAEAERVLAALEAADIPLLPEPGRWRDRIHLGIVKVAAGDWGRFQEALRLAETDWRDLLVAADLANGDWPEVLAREGFRVP